MLTLITNNGDAKIAFPCKVNIKTMVNKRKISVTGLIAFKKTVSYHSEPLRGRKNFRNP